MRGDRIGKIDGGRVGTRLPVALGRWYLRQLGPARRVLDAGCGAGDLGRLAGGRMEFHGLDRDPRLVASAGRFARAARFDLEAGTLPFDDGFFDGVVAKDVLEHLAQPMALVLEFRRVLRPGGTLLASVPMPKPSAVWADYTHVRGFTRGAISNLLRDAGFRVRRIRRMGPLPLGARLGLMSLVPLLLLVPGLTYFARSYEVVATKAGARCE